VPPLALNCSTRSAVELSFIAALVGDAGDFLSEVIHIFFSSLLICRLRLRRRRIFSADTDTI
jgi:hypothetical protein